MQLVFLLEMMRRVMVVYFLVDCGSKLDVDALMDEDVACLGKGQLV